jgi:hypothetical protein
MTKIFKYALVLTVASSIFMFCGTYKNGTSGETPDNNTDNGTFTVPANQAAEYTANDWKLEIAPIGTMIPDSLEIVFDIGSDSTYALMVVDPPSKTIFSHTGTWSASGTNMYLSATECLVLDTASEPDTLSHLSDSICSLPVTIPMTLDTSSIPWEWVIRGTSLGAAVDAFPVSEEAKIAVRALEFRLQMQ